MRPRRRASARAFGTVAILALGAGAAMAMPADQVPQDLQGVGVTEHLGAEVPLDLEFTRSDGRPVKLRELLLHPNSESRRPVILTMNYSDCPMLCSLQLTGLVDGLRGLKWSIGEDFELVTVSLEPTEKPARAAATHDRYLGAYALNREVDRAEADAGWSFLVGSEANIRALAEAVGFGYQYVEERKEYAHAAVVMLLTPDGHVARYLYGVDYPSNTLRLGLLEASKGEIGTTLDQLILYCFHYNPKEGRYTPAAVNVMRLGGGLTVILLSAVVGTYILRERRARRVQHAAAALSAVAAVGGSGQHT